MPAAPMLMIVPLMIWSIRSEMDSQACSKDTAMPATRAATRPMTSGMVMPK